MPNEPQMTYLQWKLNILMLCYGPSEAGVSAIKDLLQQTVGRLVSPIDVELSTRLNTHLDMAARTGTAIIAASFYAFIKASPGFPSLTLKNDKLKQPKGVHPPLSADENPEVTQKVYSQALNDPQIISEKTKFKLVTSFREPITKHMYFIWDLENSQGKLLEGFDHLVIQEVRSTIDKNRTKPTFVNTVRTTVGEKVSCLLIHDHFCPTLTRAAIIVDGGKRSEPYMPTILPGSATGFTPLQPVSPFQYDLLALSLTYALGDEELKSEMIEKSLGSQALSRPTNDMEDLAANRTVIREAHNASKGNCPQCTVVRICGSAVIPTHIPNGLVDQTTIPATNPGAITAAQAVASQQYQQRY